MNKIEFDFNVPQDYYVEVYDPNDKLVMRTNNENKFLYICCQIKDAKADGYYVVILDEYYDQNAEKVKYPIKSNGRVIGANNKLFQVHSDLLRKLIKVMTEEQIEGVLKSVNFSIKEDNHKYIPEDIKSDTPSKPTGCYVIKENHLNPDYPLVFYGEWNGSHFYSHHVSSSSGRQQIVHHEQDDVLGYIEYKTE